MKKIIFLTIMAAMTACTHDHKKDKVIGNVHDVYLKEVNQMKADMVKDRLLFKKKIVDSMNVVFKKAPESKNKGWYSAKDLHLPTGTCISFNPTDGTSERAKTGPYYIIIRGFDGKQSINKVDQEKWRNLLEGDVLK
jgi:hypothetical protein